MSGKLDQSLDEILSTQRSNARNSKTRGRGRRAPAAGRTAGVTAPVGGIKKTTKQTQTKGVAKVVPTGPAGAGDSKIQVSNLPKDVNEPQIKEYFIKSVGPIKRVEISYGPGGVSRGIATIWFTRSDGAAKAVSALNGLLVDGKPMKIEVILDARRAATIPAPKGLSERVTAPKSQPKSAANPKNSDADKAGARGGKGRGRGGKARSARPTKKTAEELDSEMADYFDNGAAATSTDAPAANGAAQPAANGDAMDDDIL